MTNRIMVERNERIEINVNKKSLSDWCMDSVESLIDQFLKFSRSIFKPSFKRAEKNIIAWSARMWKSFRTKQFFYPPTCPTFSPFQLLTTILGIDYLCRYCWPEKNTGQEDKKLQINSKYVRPIKSFFKSSHLKKKKRKEKKWNI